MSCQGQGGNPGYAAWSGNVNFCNRAKGGETLYGISYAEIVHGPVNGVDGSGYGSGGTGSGNSASLAAKTGGNGAPGFFKLREIY